MGPLGEIAQDFNPDTKLGIHLIRACKNQKPSITSVVMIASDLFTNAAYALKEGAFDYLSMPFSNEQLWHTFNKVSALVSLKRENHHLWKMFERSSDQFEFRTLEELEREEIKRVLAIEHNQEQAAKILGIATVTLWRKRKELGI